MPKASAPHTTDNSHLRFAVQSLTKTELSDMLLLTLVDQLGDDDTVILAKMERLLEKARAAAKRPTRSPISRLFRKRAEKCLAIFDTIPSLALQTTAVASLAVADAIEDYRKESGL